MTAEETIASLTAQLKEAVERLREVSEDLRQTQEQFTLWTKEELDAIQPSPRTRRTSAELPIQEKTDTLDR
jgi:hypothetical protein